MSKKYILIVAIIVIIGTGAYFLLDWQRSPSSQTITNFEECAQAGYPVAESYPAQCWTPDGRRFVEEIDQSPPPALTVAIENISPASGSLGAKITITGSGFHPTDNDIAFTHPEINFQGRNTAYLNSIPSQDGETLQFNLPDNENVLLGACAVSQTKPNEICPDIGILLPKGVVQVSVVNTDGQSNSMPFTVSSPTASVQTIATPAGELFLSYKDGQARLEGVLQRSTPCVEWEVRVTAAVDYPPSSVEFYIFDKNKDMICIQILGDPQQIFAVSTASEETHYRVVFKDEEVFSGTL